MGDSSGSAGRRRRPDFVEDAIDDGASGDGVRSDGAVDGGAVRKADDDVVVMLMKPFLFVESTLSFAEFLFLKYLFLILLLFLFLFLNYLFLFLFLLQKVRIRNIKST